MLHTVVGNLNGNTAPSGRKFRSPNFTFTHYEPMALPCSCHKNVILHDFMLTFKQPGWYLNFSEWFMKNVLFEQKKKKL
jgi:hypothetical protein